MCSGLHCVTVIFCLPFLSKVLCLSLATDSSSGLFSVPGSNLTTSQNKCEKTCFYVTMTVSVVLYGYMGGCLSVLCVTLLRSSPSSISDMTPSHLFTSAPLAPSLFDRCFYRCVNVQQKHYYAPYSAQQTLF